jgi:beta-lactam-binding protein with PASTA domain
VQEVKNLKALFGPIHITVFRMEKDPSQEGKVVEQAPPPGSTQPLSRGIRLFRGMVSAHMPDATSRDLAALGI